MQGIFELFLAAAPVPVRNANQKVLRVAASSLQLKVINLSLEWNDHVLLEPFEIQLSTVNLLKIYNKYFLIYSNPNISNLLTLFLCLKPKLRYIFLS